MDNNTVQITNNITNNGLDIFHIDHLGLVSTFLDQIGLVQFIDSLLPKSREHNVTHGEAFKFLLLSCFDQKRRALYNLCHNMAKTPLFLFFKRDIDILDFNDDILANFLEVVNNYGTSAFFLRIIQHLAPKLPTLLDFDRLHADITNFTVYGQYSYTEFENHDNELIKIVHGHPKDKRSHLKCLSLALITNTIGSPVFMKPLDGNCSDNKELNLLIRDFFNNIKNTLSDKSDPLFIADAAFFSKNNIANFPADFITRVPETLSESHNLIYSNLPLSILENDPRYSFYATKSSYGDVEQTWLLVHSTEMADKQTITFERKINKAMSAANSALKTLGKRQFACEEDAKRAAENWISKEKYCKFDTLDIICKENRFLGKKGRPIRGEKLEKNYFVRGTLIFDLEVVEQEKLGLGRFILSTNRLSLSAEQILTYYKEQSKVEKCFRYLKSNELRLSEILLKKPERIQGLCCFMALFMLVSSLLETILRQGMENKGQAIATYKNKATTKPTLNLAFKQLQGICGQIIYKPETNSYAFRISLRMLDEMLIILEQFGDEVLKLYTYQDIPISAQRARLMCENIIASSPRLFINSDNEE
jgi:transposase